MSWRRNSVDLSMYSVGSSYPPFGCLLFSKLKTGLWALPLANSGARPFDTTASWNPAPSAAVCPAHSEVAVYNCSWDLHALARSVLFFSWGGGVPLTALCVILFPSPTLVSPFSYFFPLFLSDRWPWFLFFGTAAPCPSCKSGSGILLGHAARGALL